MKKDAGLRCFAILIVEFAVNVYATIKERTSNKRIYFDKLMTFLLHINKCTEQPCSLLFDCVDHLNGFSCKLVVWKLVVIGLAILMILGGFVFLLCFLKKKRNKITAGMISAYVILHLFL